MTFTVSASTTNPSQSVTVFYSTTGKAKNGKDYTLSGTPGQVTIPAGQSSATITLHALTDNIVETNEKATLTLLAGAGYRLGTVIKASVTIINR